MLFVRRTIRSFRFAMLLRPSLCGLIPITADRIIFAVVKVEHLPRCQPYCFTDYGRSRNLPAAPFALASDHSACCLLENQLAFFLRHASSLRRSRSRSRGVRFKLHHYRQNLELDIS
jgi:hypothetical protein